MKWTASLGSTSMLAIPRIGRTAASWTRRDPRTLIYAQGPTGPVLLGAMSEMPDGSTPGPDLGGPLATWHAHEHICFGLLPTGMTGLLSPLGGCPVGSVDITRTPQMIHVWVADGTPVHWGELDDTWKAEYVAGTT